MRILEYYTSEPVMKISVIQFKGEAGEIILSRGVSVICSDTDFIEAVLEAFGQLQVDELFLQLAGAEDPKTYSQEVQQSLYNAFLDLTASHPHLLSERSVKVVDPTGNTLMQFCLKNKGS